MLSSYVPERLDTALRPERVHCLVLSVVITHMVGWPAFVSDFRQKGGVGTDHAHPLQTTGNINNLRTSRLGVPCFAARLVSPLLMVDDRIHQVVSDSLVR